MSHISKIKTQVVEKEYLLAALADLGYDVQQGELSVAGFRGQETPVEILLKLPLSNDIGFRLEDGRYTIVADWYGVHGVTARAFTNQLTQRYAYHTTKAKMEEQGFSLVEETNEKGKIHLVLRRMA